MLTDYESKLNQKQVEQMEKDKAFREQVLERLKKQDETNFIKSMQVLQEESERRRN